MVKVDVKMPPRDEPKLESKLEDGELKRSTSNVDLMPDAGKVHIDEAQMWGRGIVNDFKRTVGTHWVKEMINLNQKTIAVTFLVFISVIAPTLTFGAVYGKATENQMGTIETILSTAWVGIAYSLIGGMPIVSVSVAKTNHNATWLTRLSASSVRPVRCWPSRRSSSACPSPLEFHS